MTPRDRLAPSALGLVALLVWGILPGDLASGTPLRIREVLRNDLPSRADLEQMERGYYEQLADSSHQIRDLSGSHALDSQKSGGTPDAATGENERLTHRVADVREFVLKPNIVRDPERHIPWSTNPYGMRDQNYDVNKPANTYRIALAGDSIATGWGVDDHEGFEPRLEKVFDERSRAAGGPSVQFLNFAVPGHGPGQRWTHFSQSAWAFSPDLVIYEATPADIGWDERRLRGNLTRGIGFDAPVYRAVLESAGIRPGLSPEVYRGALKPLRWDLLANVYRVAARECQSHGVPCLWVLIPRVGKPIDPSDRRRLLALARESGFAAVIDASDVYDGADPHTLAVSPTDFHPNAQGHARIAQALGQALVNRPELSLLWAPPRTTNRPSPEAARP